MKRSRITLLLTIICSTILAQENFTDGYIITNTNDTIYGKVDLRTSSINQARCLFSPEKTGEQTYHPGDIKGYRYTSAGKYYVSKEVSIEEKPLSIFAEYLVEGGLSLYYIKGDNQSYFLFEEEGKDPFYVTQNTPKEVNSKIYTDNKYIGALTYHFQDSSPLLLRLIEKAKFNQKSMIAITKQYNDENCLNPGQESCIIFENQTPDKENFKIQFSVYTGIQSMSYHDSRYNTDSKVYPVIGGQFYLHNPLWTKDFGLLGDISFSKMKDDSPIFEIPITNNLEQIQYDFYTLSLKLGLKYTYSKFRFKPSISGGFAYTNIIKNNSELLRSIGSPKEYDIRSNHTGGYFAAGMDYNIRKNQSIFIQFSHDFYVKSDLSQKKSSAYIKLWQLKVGYTF